MDSTPPLKRRAIDCCITQRLATALDKCKISKRNAMHLLMAAAEAFKVDTTNLILNSTSIHEARQKFRMERYEEIKTLVPALFSNLPSTIHWDGKLLAGPSRAEKVDRLAIIITSKGVEQILGVPKIESSSGNNQAAAVHETVVDWAVAESIRALCCDTTATRCA